MASPKVDIGEFIHTPVDSIPALVGRLRSTFMSHKTKDVQYRLRQLRKLYWGICDLQSKFVEALNRDLGMSAFEAELTEIDFVLQDLSFVLKNLEKWVKEERVSGMNPAFFMLKHRVRKEPLGTCLVIGAYNFPVQLALGPCIGAIAAGNTVVLKPSESSPATAAVITTLFENYLDSDSYTVVNGAVEETTALLDQKWDKIFYTGSNRIGKIITKKAAETLTPVALELGGQNPAFVTRNSDVALAARRVLYGKVFNAGQICISTNYVLVDREVLPAFVDALKTAFQTYFPSGAKSSPDFARIVNQRQFLRIKKMIDESKGKIIIGGEMDESQLYIEPTVVLVDSKDDSMIVDETFGPAFSVLPVDNLDEAISIANEVYATPLSLATFGSDAENKKILDRVTSGGASINDAFVHASMSPAPFGGVGQSGSGCYRGKASFDTFSHARTIAQTPGWADGLFRVRYMPYSFKKLNQMPRPPRKNLGFDRDGNPIRGLKYWLGFVVSLGADGPKGALLRWLLVVVSAVALTRKGGLLGQ
ncbi:hypothetical protein jhhlp_006111 [Lomentospora prolificans]|uniref:Aldehyde dehydrogenase n=1 Tax=Lomentospora prolificans TaxID=41688 RepID=A0A2N3N503_9PEZI|nr:hypothetical protein jhhlp_006111 [Lomentospora prolificans]